MVARARAHTHEDAWRACLLARAADEQQRRRAVALVVAPLPVLRAHRVSRNARPPRPLARRTCRCRSRGRTAPLYTWTSSIHDMTPSAGTEQATAEPDASGQRAPCSPALPTTLWCVSVPSPAAMLHKLTLPSASSAYSEKKVYPCDRHASTVAAAACRFWATRTTDGAGADDSSGEEEEEDGRQRRMASQFLTFHTWAARQRAPRHAPAAARAPTRSRPRRKRPAGPARTPST